MDENDGRRCRLLKVHRRVAGTSTAGGDRSASPSVDGLRRFAQLFYTAGRRFDKKIVQGFVAARQQLLIVAIVLFDLIGFEGRARTPTFRCLSYQLVIVVCIERRRGDGTAWRRPHFFGALRRGRCNEALKASLIQKKNILNLFDFSPIAFLHVEQIRRFRISFSQSSPSTSRCPIMTAAFGAIGSEIRQLWFLFHQIGAKRRNTAVETSRVLVFSGTGASGGYFSASASARMRHVEIVQGIVGTAGTINHTTRNQDCHEKIDTLERKVENQKSTTS
uniref:Uncharacterized protein n=1 Tax=Romanomermis culicivorax TaxID=13658 RepID=A0A915L0N8_ROMCU